MRPKHLLAADSGRGLAQFDIARNRQISEKCRRFACLKAKVPMISDAIRAVILGIVEGVTEFLPVSSTGHLLLVERFFEAGGDDFWKSFAILIQLGAILAILAIYFVKLWQVALGMFTDPAARRFVIGVVVAGDRRHTRPDRAGAGVLSDIFRRPRAGGDPLPLAVVAGARVHQE
jgi:hypothetical protein